MLKAKPCRFSYPPAMCLAFSFDLEAERTTLAKSQPFFLQVLHNVDLKSRIKIVLKVEQLLKS